MKPVGNYAYSIAFSDGHDTGIFSFEMTVPGGSSPCHSTFRYGFA